MATEFDIEIKDSNISNNNTYLFDLPNSLGSIRWVGTNNQGQVINQPVFLSNTNCTINFSCQSKAQGNDYFELLSQPDRGNICSVSNGNIVYFSPSGNSILTPYFGTSLVDSNDSMIFNYLIVWNSSFNEGAFCEFKVIYSELDEQGTRKRVNIIGTTYSLT